MSKRELLAAIRDFEAGCEKLPPALREQCEKKVEEGKKNKENGKDKEATRELTEATQAFASTREARNLSDLPGFEGLKGLSRSEQQEILLKALADNAAESRRLKKKVEEAARGLHKKLREASDSELTEAIQAFEDHLAGERVAAEAARRRRPPQLPPRDPRKIQVMERAVKNLKDELDNVVSAKDKSPWVSGSRRKALENQMRQVRKSLDGLTGA